LLVRKQQREPGPSVRLARLQGHITRQVVGCRLEIPFVGGAIGVRQQDSRLAAHLKAMKKVHTGGEQGQHDDDDAQGL